MKVLSERIKEAQMEMKAKANFITNDIVSGKSSLYTYSVSYDENAAKLDGKNCFSFNFLLSNTYRDQ